MVAGRPVPEPAQYFQRRGKWRVAAAPAVLPGLPSALRDFDCRNNRLAASALEQLRPAVERLVARYGESRVAVVMGTSTSGIASSEAAAGWRHRKGSYPAEYHSVQGMLAGLGQFAAAFLGLSGPATTVSTACASSASAVLSARRLLRLGLADAVVVGGVDSLCELTLRGFAALEALASGYSKPFCRDRDGINLGEAAAVFLMSREPGPVALLGGGASSDAHHISAPHPAGRGAYQAMSAALADARLQAMDIDYVNLHGTGTTQNDSMEALAVHGVFGEVTPCSSSKSMTGHTLGACGALELAICWLLLNLESGWRLPPSLYAGDRDDTLPAINLTGTADAGRRRPRHCLSNSFAFGGSNVSLLIGRVDA